MSAMGRREVDAARADGRWDAAYAPQSKAEPPPDLVAALEGNQEAARLFAGLTAPTVTP